MDSRLPQPRPQQEVEERQRQRQALRPLHQRGQEEHQKIVDYLE